jgi:hypothetical protein
MWYDVQTFARVVFTGLLLCFCLLNRFVIARHDRGDMAMMWQSRRWLPRGDPETFPRRRAAGIAMMSEEGVMRGCVTG